MEFNIIRDLIAETGHVYYIVFDKHRGANRLWWHYILDKRFMHCFVVARTPDNKTMILNPAHWGVNILIKDREIEESLVHLHNYKVTDIIEYQLKVKKREKFKFRGIYTCVTFIKALLNIRGLALSPKMLHKYLLESGGIQVFK